MVEGLDKFNRRWKAIPRNAKINVRAALEDMANDLVEEMWSRAPYDDGTLQASIGWTWGDAPAGTLTIGSVGGREYGSMRITIYAGGGDAFYARFQEFGTVKQVANPFFFPVWRANRKRVRGRISRAISKAIKQS